jgi:drug/metabolite transporter (DMT)-like permease
MAICIGWLWLGEVPRWISLLGGSVALVGVVLVNTKGRTMPARAAAMAAVAES